MSASTYWSTTIRKADSRSPKEGAEKRLDRLRGVLRGVDPVVATRAWREVGDALQTITDRYAR
ncbi:hypothetical protein [Streptomyces xiamenensis]|uniref:hypothetical protein n=1 Tax=Streptomyces xiamenensis TaxID=408015 RepID=UPI0035D8E49F